MKNHKIQSLIITIAFFLPILFLVFYIPRTFIKERVGEQVQISVAVKQFVVAQTMQQAAPAPAPQIEEPEPPKPIAKEAPKKRKPPKKPQKQEIQQVQKVQEEQVVEQAVIPDTSVAAESSAISTLVYGENDDPFLKNVKRAIDEAGDYPRQARKMRIVGKVWLEFVWLENSILHGLRIIQSSGHDILDKDALRTIRMASKKFPKHERSVRLQVPIVYDLRNLR